MKETLFFIGLIISLCGCNIESRNLISIKSQNRADNSVEAVSMQISNKTIISRLMKDMKMDILQRF